MDKTFQHQQHEQKLYALWEKSGAFQPASNASQPTNSEKAKTKEPFSVLLPPPNANASLHAGHAMYVIEDILVRFKRMQGHPTVWIPGTDHAGYESQYVYEKHLAKEDKSRFDFDRATFYKNMEEFVQKNSGLIEEQLKLLGFSCDWTRKTFMLDDHVIKTVYDTFKKLAKDGLIYRDNYIVNYCPKCGTTFADLEVIHKEQLTSLYYIKYGPFIVATTRPETMFGDTAVAVHPNDTRYTQYIGTTIEFDGPIGPMKLQVVADEHIDPAFGTGAMKVTPAHDANDFAIGRRHHLPVVNVINLRGKLDLSAWTQRTDLTPAQQERVQQYHNKSTAEVRKLVVADLEKIGMLDHIDDKYMHNTLVCYKSNHAIEPLVIPNWFIKMKPLAEPAIQAMKDKRVRIVPDRFEKQYYEWLEKFIDWPISRQIVWGIRIPAWYSVKKNPEIEVTFLNKNGERVISTVGEALQTYSFSEIRDGLQQLRAPINAEPTIGDENPGNQQEDEFLPETDTFDTWFSSGQWPLTTLHFPNGEDFKRFYPTSVLDTMWDILFFWVARMIMFGLYMTGDVPFKTVYLHSMVTDEKGQKMSKSKGNVINPIDIVQEFGADALRISLVAGSTPGNPIALSKEKVKGYRNFANKLWNIGRFILMQKEQGVQKTSTIATATTTNAREVALLEKLHQLVENTTTSLEKYRFSDAALALYDFVWNDFANTYLEETKQAENKEEVFTTLVTVFSTCLKMLHPFMPFVTEAIWQELYAEKLVDEPLLISAQWPNEQ